MANNSSSLAQTEGEGQNSERVMTYLIKQVPNLTALSTDCGNNNSLCNNYLFSQEINCVLDWRGYLKPLRTHWETIISLVHDLNTFLIGGGVYNSSL